MVILLILLIPLFLLLPQKAKILEPHHTFLPLFLPFPLIYRRVVLILKILFRILNLNPTSSLRMVRRAYYLLTRKYHPDKWNEEISKITKAESEERFKSISNTFEDLKIANCLV